MKKFRKILALVLVTLLAVALMAGCSNDGAAAPKRSPPPRHTPSPTSTDSLP